MHEFDPHHNVVFQNDHEEQSSGMPPDAIGMQPLQAELSNSPEASRDEERLNIGEESDESASNGAHHHGCRMHDIGDWDHIYDADYEQGDEGVEHHQIEAPFYERHSLAVPGYGIIPFPAIFSALANHDWCTCHSIPAMGILSEEYMSDMNSQDPSGMQTPCSLHVEFGSSGNPSLESSMHFTPRTESPTAFLAFIGEAHFQPTPVNYFTSAPIWLTAEPPRRSHYVSGLEPIESDSSDDDM